MRKFTLILVSLCLMGLQGVFGQGRLVSGTITSTEDGKGVPGATVLVKGTTIGTFTNIDGKYALSVPAPHKVLVVSCVGMKTKEVTLGSADVMDVAIDPDVLNVDEVVVTAIGIPRQSKALGYSVQSVGGEQIDKLSNTSMINSLQGRVSGVQVVNSTGAAGGSQYVQIRGVHSLTQDNQPLFVVDGVPVNNSGGDYQVDGVATSNRGIDLNPDDIESINVLKGGAATALYGMRAANGAIIITTKKGTAGVGKKINVTFNSNVTFSKYSMMPKLQDKYGQGINGNWVSGQAATWGPLLDTCSYDITTPNPWNEYDVDGMIVSKNDPNATGDKVKTYDPYDFFQTGVKYNNSLSLVGGNDNANYYFSFSDLQEKGIIPNNKYRRNTFKIATQAKVSKWFSMSADVNYIISGGDRIQQGSNTSGVMLGLLRTPSTFDNSAGYELTGGIQRNYRHGVGYDNPYWTANKNKYTDQVNRLIGNTQFTAIATEWLTFTYRLGVDWFSTKYKDYFAINSRSFPFGRVNVRNQVNRDISSDLLAIVNKDLTKDINMKLTLGHSMTELYYQYNDGLASDIFIPEYYNLNNTTSISASERTWKLRRAGIFGDLGLSWKSMIFVNITGRNDWSTTLPEKNNSFFYPSFSGGFVFTELPFLKDNKYVPYGKIRASYSIVALDATPYNTLTYYYKPLISDGWLQPDGIIFPVNGITAWSINTQIGNENLKPEKTKTFEVGADLKFINNRAGIGFTWFKNNGEDLLLPVSIAASSGFLSYYGNTGSLETKGIELTIEGKPVKSKNFEWNVIVNFSQYKSEVVKLAEGIDNLFLGGFTDPQVRAVVGMPYRSFYGYDWERDADGNVIIDDSGTPETNPNYGYPIYGSELVPLGDVDPDWTMGITNTFTYKNVSLSFLFDIKKGGKMWNGTRGALDYFGTSFGTVTRDEDYVYEGVRQSNGVANDIVVKLDQNWRRNLAGSGFIGPTSPYIEESEWIRLRNLTLSYSFTNMLKKTFIKGLDIYFTGTNLWILTPYTGVDPETSLLGNANAQGIDYFNMPGTKSYTVGLILAF